MSPPEEHLWFNAEVKPCEPQLRAYLVRRFPSLTDHDDLMQEAYTRVLCAKRNGQLTCVKAYLFTVTRNLAIDNFRRWKAARHEPLDEETELPTLNEMADATLTLERQQRLELLIEAVASLPERCREVMMLRHLDGLSYKEIADRLGISANTVRVHMVKGVKDCAAFFRKHGMLDTEMARSGALPTEESA